MSMFDGDSTFRGGAVNMTGATSLVVPVNSIVDASVSAAAPLGTTKTRKRHYPKHSQYSGAANVIATDLVHEVYGAAGSIIAIRGSVQVACIAPSLTTVDVKKNGVSILTAPFTINAAAGVADVAGSVATPSLVAGDKLTVVVTLTGGGTQGQGLFVQIVVDEDPA